MLQNLGRVVFGHCNLIYQQKELLCRSQESGLPSLIVSLAEVCEIRSLYTHGYCLRINTCGNMEQDKDII